MITGFVAAVPGSGRTSVVADLAWNLANAGLRVLVVDWGSAAPVVADYLQPFEIGTGLLTDYQVEVEQAARAGFRHETEGARLSKYAVPSDDGVLHVIGPDGSFDSASDFRSPTSGRLASDDGVLTRLREVLRRAPTRDDEAYDVVLVDWPTGAGEEFAARVPLLCDAAVVCFRPQPRAIASSAALARSIWRFGPTMRVVAAAIQSDVGLAERIDRLIEQQFPEADLAGLDIVKVPYQPFSLLGEILSTLFSAEDGGRALLSSFDELAYIVTVGRIRGLPPVPAFVQQAYHRAFDPSARYDEGEPVRLIYLPLDRAWADWLQARLRQAGVNALLRSVRNDEEPDFDAAMTLVVMSRARAVGPDGAGLVRAMLEAAAHHRIFAVRVSGEVSEPPRPPTLPAEIGHLHQLDSPDFAWIDISDRDEAEAWGSIRARLGLIDSSRGRAGSVALPNYSAFPGRGGDRYTNLPQRDELFVGRIDDLEKLRDQLLDAEGRHEVTLEGEPGVGKSAIALEYAHRFAHDYSIVWWIPADNPFGAPRQFDDGGFPRVEDHSQMFESSGIRRSLHELGERLGIEAAGNPVQAVLDTLATRPTRWLLIYDNADAPNTPAELKSLLPGSGPGHVIFTSRTDRTPEERPDTLIVKALHKAEGVELLRTRVPGLAVEDAERLIAPHRSSERSPWLLPLTLAATASWISEQIERMRRDGRSNASGSLIGDAVEEFLRLRAVELEKIVDVPLGSEHGPFQRASIEAIVSIILRTLDGTLEATPGEVAGAEFGDERRVGRLTVRLAEMCAFLSPDGVALRLLRSAPMIEQLAAAADEASPDTDPGAPSDGALLIEDTAELDRALWRGARSGLFDVAWGRVRTVSMHRVVRSAILNRLPSNQYAARWNQVVTGLAGFAPTDAEMNVPERKPDFHELQRHIYTSFAIYSDAPIVQRWLPRQFRYVYTEGDPVAVQTGLRQANETLLRWNQADVSDRLSARLQGEIANLHRILGENRESYRIDKEVWETQQQDPLRRRHPRTWILARGLAADERDGGLYLDARDRDAATYRGLLTEYGDDHPDTRKAASNLAWSDFLAGDTRQALARTEDLYARAQLLDGPSELMVWWMRMLVGTYRRELGQYDSAMQVLIEARDGMSKIRPSGHADLLRIDRAVAVTARRLKLSARATEIDAQLLQSYRAMFGDSHPATRSCRMSLAADYNAVNDVAKAVDEGAACVRDYTVAIGADHPLTQLCRVNMAVFQRAAGKTGRALELVRAARAGLNDRLGPLHPWTLAALINEANALASEDRWDAAVELIDSTYRDCHEILLLDHPYTRTADENRRRMRPDSASGRRVSARSLEDIDIDIPLN